MSLSDFEDPRYVKSAKKHVRVKGCPGNDGRAHYYVHQHIIETRVPNRDQTDMKAVTREFDSRPHCLLCDKVGPRSMYDWRSRQAKNSELYAIQKREIRDHTKAERQAESNKFLFSYVLLSTNTRYI